MVFDASFTWEWMHSTENFYKKNHDIGTLYQVLEKYNSSFPEDAYRMYFTSNHDENSWNGTGYEKYGSMLKPLAVFSCTWNGIPMIYSGEELPNLKRLHFFDKDTIEWTDKCELHDFYKTLLTLRKTNPALRAADNSVATFHILTGASKNVMAYLRKHEEDEILVLLNLSNDETGFVLQDRLVNGKFTEVFSNTNHILMPETFIKMHPWGYLVFEKEKG